MSTRSTRPGPHRLTRLRPSVRIDARSPPCVILPPRPTLAVELRILAFLIEIEIERNAASGELARATAVAKLPPAGVQVPVHRPEDEARRARHHPRTRSLTSALNFVTFHVSLAGQANATAAAERSYLQLVDLMFRSALRTHPGARATILTDHTTDLSRLTTPFTRSEHPVRAESLMLDRTLAQLAFVEAAPPARGIVLLDSDMLVTGSLQHLFDEDFDVALTWRDNPLMPINGGLILVQQRRASATRSFFERYLALYRERYAAESGWYGDQFALRDLVGIPNDAYPRNTLIDRDGIRVRLLPCAEYNFSPRNRTRSVIRPLRGPRVLHFNGSRKRLMPLYWNAHLSGHGAAGEIARHYLRRRLRRLGQLLGRLAA